MAFNKTKPGDKAVGGGLPSIYKPKEQLLSLQAQKEDLKQFVMEMLTRHDEIMNQNLEKFRQEIKDLVQQKSDNLKQYILTALKSFSKIIIQEDKKVEEIHSIAESKTMEADFKLCNLDNKLQRFENELTKIQEMRSEVELKIKQAEHKISNVDNIMQKTQDGFTMIQFRSMEFAVRLRGLKEDSTENLRKIVADEFAVILKCKPEELISKVEKAYRVNSGVAKQRQLPRDVVIYFTDKSIRNDIVQKSFNSTLEVKGTKIQIFKELPSTILKYRKAFGFLSTQLKKRNIPFRWDIPIGIILRYQGERYQLNTVEKAEEFYYKVLKMNLTSSRRSSAIGIQEGDKEKQNLQKTEAKPKQMEMEVMERQQATEDLLGELLLNSPLDATAGLVTNTKAKRFYKTKKF